MRIVQFFPQDDILEISYKNVFREIFAKDTPNAKTSLAALISAAIDKHVTVDNVLLDLPLKDLCDTQTRFGVQCRDSDGQMLNVEMVMYPGHFDPLGFEFTVCKLFTSQCIGETDGISSGLRPTYQINILAKKNFAFDERYYHHFQYFDKDTQCNFDGGTHIITVELAKTGNIAEKDITDMTAMDRWAIFLRYCSDQRKRDLVDYIFKLEPCIAMAAEALLSVSKDKNERARLLND